MTNGGSPPIFELASGYSNYLDTFHSHQESVQNHLNGQLDSDDPLLPSFLPPASYWTAEEKNLFFHGLTVHSRLRPDLIAAHIKTKNTIEVCLYLHCLQTASAQKSQDSPEEMQRISLPFAMEVSENWIRDEEILAERLKDLESCSWRAVEDGVHEQSSCSCPSFNIDGGGSGSRGSAYLSHLDPVCLTTQESLIREATVKVQDMWLQTRTNPLEETTQAGPSTINQDQNSQGDLRSSPALSESLQGMIEKNETLINDKKLQRQLKKRLYMRKKRAEQSGRPVDPVSIRLRPGRAKRIRKLPKPRPKSYNTKNKPGSNPIEEGGEDLYESRSKGGTTRPYRIKKIFQDSGIDAQIFSDMDLDLFHLSTLARLLRLYTSINDPEASLDSVSISARTIQLFADVTKDFVSEVIRRAVVTKEQEIRMKRMMPVWKYDREEITIENVAECLYSMGLGHLSKEKYFEALLVSEDLEAATFPIPEEPSEETKPEPTPNLSKDQLFRTPQHTLPQSMLWCSLPSHRDLLFTDEVWAEEDLDEVDKEIEDEEDLNAKDERISADYERSLWSMNE